MSRPIPIAPRSRGVPVARGRHSSSSSVPTAPVIGSLPPPSALEGDIPDMSLPESIPDAFSLVRMAGAVVASCNARFDEAAGHLLFLPMFSVYL